MELAHVEDVRVLVEGNRDELEQQGLAPGLQGRAALGHLRVRVGVGVRVRVRVRVSLGRLASPAFG